MNKHENPNTGRPWEPNVKDTIKELVQRYISYVKKLLMLSIDIYTT